MSATDPVRALVARRPTLACATPGAALAFAIGVYQLSRPHVLWGIHGYTGQGYDDGVYLGAAIRLVHGALPYRDFTFLHPPGVPILMAPIALVGTVLGSHVALMLTRCVTLAVVVANAGLAAALLSFRGRRSSVAGGLALGCYPLAVAATPTLTLEPYLVLFCLLGLVLLFDRGEMASDRRVMLGGIALGFAGVVKIWAIFPAASLLLVLALKRSRRPALPLACGLVFGFGVPALPFMLASARGFVHQVVSAQLSRGSTGQLNLSASQRVTRIVGLNGLSAFHESGRAALIVVALVTLITLGAFALSTRSRTTLDWVLLSAATTSSAATFASPEFYDHYAYFPAAFLALVLVLAVADLAELTASGLGMPVPLRMTARARVFSAAVAAIAVLAVVPQSLRYSRDLLKEADEPRPDLMRAISPGACVVFDVATLAIDADRFTSSSGGCPDLVDPFGLWIVEDDGNPPPGQQPFSPHFVDLWRTWLDQADAVLLSVDFSNYIPWTPELIAHLNANFHVTFSRGRVVVYSRVRP